MSVVAVSLIFSPLAASSGSGAVLAYQKTSKASSERSAALDQSSGEVGGGYARSVIGSVGAGSSRASGAAVNPRGSVTAKQALGASPDSPSAPGGAVTPSGDSGAQRPAMPRVAGADSWTGAREAEGTGVLTRQGRKLLVGSNPTLSVASRSRDVKRGVATAPISVGESKTLGESIGFAAHPSRESAAKCRSVGRGLTFYRTRYLHWRQQQGIREHRIFVKPRGCKYALFLAALWRSRSFEARRAYGRWFERTYEKWRCLHEHEGAWNDPNPPHYGGLQFDDAFQRTYGPEFFARWGDASHWPVYAQLIAAERAYQTRGFHPWPNTARACGLL